MPTYVSRDDTFEEVSDDPAEGLSVRVRAPAPPSAPEVHFRRDADPFFVLSGAAPRPRTDTTHTVALVRPDEDAGTLLFAVHADGQDLIFDDLRAGPAADGAVDDALEQVQASLNEIMIPVYIDDVIGDLSEALDGLVALHTIQQADDGETWTYFRTSIHEGGTLTLESEHGEL